MTLNEPDEIRRAFGCYPTGVAVVTTRTNAGEPVGITISSFNSVSLDPPLILWNVARESCNFDGLECAEGVAGDPILPEFAGCFQCSTEHTYPGGDHMIIVGRVLDFEDRMLEPLIFHRSSYRRVDDVGQ